MIVLDEGGDFFDGDTCLPAIIDDVAADLDLGAEFHTAIEIDTVSIRIMNCIA